MTRATLKTLQLPASEQRLRPISLDDMVRVGRDHDGGYVLPSRMIHAADSVLALGLSEDWSFEAGLAGLKPGLRIHGYDHSISREQFVRTAWKEALKLALFRGSLAEVQRRMLIVRAYDQLFTGQSRHFVRKITNRPEGPFEIDLTGALDRLGGERVLVKMDIEGSEYRVIDQLVLNAPRIVGACIEFHDIDPLRALFDQAVDQLLVDYAIAHVHPNNFGKVAPDGLPEFLEITFINRTLVDRPSFRSQIYLPDFDQPNDPDRPDLSMII